MLTPPLFFYCFELSPKRTFNIPNKTSIVQNLDYGSPVSISATPYTAPQDGWVIVNITRAYNSTDWGSVIINGTHVAAIAPATNTSYGDGNAQVPVKAGDIISLEGNAKFDAMPPRFYPTPLKKLQCIKY